MYTNAFIREEEIRDSSFYVLLVCVRRVTFANDVCGVCVWASKTGVSCGEARDEEGEALR